MAKEPNIKDYIHALNMNGLQGRVLQMPPPRGHKREILVLYGHHSLLERWWGLVQNFNAYGAVTMPDLPGFGGMDSFYKIGQKPTIDNLADYLASFIKMRYRRRRFTVVGISFGFVVATRMLQRYPDIAKKVDLLVGAAAFTHHDDFKFTRPRMWMYRTLSRLFSWRGPALVFRYVALNPWVLRLAYARTHNAKHKFAEARSDADKFDAMMGIETQLWHLNDVRTNCFTTNQFLHVDNCDRRVSLPVWHVFTKNDQYFDNQIVEQHMRVIFSDYVPAITNMENHVVSVIADKRETAPLIPRKLRRYLARKQ